MPLRRPFVIVALCSVFLLVVSGTSDRNCLRANNEFGVPNYSSMQSDLLKSGIVPFQHQAIIPSYKFQCCGAITEWTVSIAISENDTMDVISLQVWRPSPTVNYTGCFNLVGNNNFTSVRVSSDSPLTVVTPLPHERILFQPGDVLGFYIEKNRVGFGSGGVMMLYDLNVRGDGGYETEEVWYATNLVFSNANCLAAVGNGKLLNSFTNVAPIISVSYTISDHCTNSLSSRTWTATPGTHSTPSGTPIPTQTATQSTASNVLATPLSVNSNFILIVGISAVVFVVIVVLTLSVVIAVCVKAKRRLSRSEKDKLAMVGSGGYVRPLLDMPTTHPTETGT